MVFQAVVVSEDAVVESCRRLIQLSPTPAPSLLSTSASEPFSDASRSCSEDGAESVFSFATVTGASGGVDTGRGASWGGGGGRSSGAAGDVDGVARARASLLMERRKYGMLMKKSSRAPGICDMSEVVKTVEKCRYRYQQGHTLARDEDSNNYLRIQRRSGHHAANQKLTRYEAEGHTATRNTDDHG